MTRRQPPAEEIAFLAVQRAADALMQPVAALLKPCGITAAQYNVLRILRGAGPAGLACGEIAARMITHDPDVTRLLDRLEKRGLIRRSRGKADRRVVTSSISPEGLRLLKNLDGPVAALHQNQLGRLGEAKLKALARLLEEAAARRG